MAGRRYNKARVGRVVTKKAGVIEGKILEGLGIGLGVSLGSFAASLIINLIKASNPTVANLAMVDERLKEQAHKTAVMMS